MKEEQSIAFYRGFLKLIDQRGRSQADLGKLLADVFQRTFGLASTREHILVAIAANKGNEVKRAWDLKQRYLVATLLQKPAITDKELIKLTKSLFSQRTRPTVIRSCRSRADQITREWNLEEIQTWTNIVHQEFQAKAKEPDVVSL